jgi:hypothetical protein
LSSCNKMRRAPEIIGAPWQANDFLIVFVLSVKLDKHLRAHDQESGQTMPCGDALLLVGVLVVYSTCLDSLDVASRAILGFLIDVDGQGEFIVDKDLVARFVLAGG